VEKGLKMGSMIGDKKSDIINQLSTAERRWFAVYTKYKCEKYVAGHLSKKNIEVYVPLVSKTKKYSKKIKHYETPLINCYVFVHITKDQYVPTLETEYVMKFLRQGKDLLAIPEEEIQILKRVAGDVHEISPLSKNLYPLGTEVEVISGQMAGLKGFIISKSGKKGFVIRLTNLGFELEISMDMQLLKPTHLVPIPI
jgi:transcription antitermination factor NusG